MIEMPLIQSLDDLFNCCQSDLLCVKVVARRVQQLPCSAKNAKNKFI